MQVRGSLKRPPTKPSERYDLYPIYIFCHQLAYRREKNQTTNEPEWVVRTANISNSPTEKKFRNRQT